MERWAWIPGYEGKYEVSDYGKVKHKFKYLRVIEKGSYKYVYLTKHGKCKQVNLLNILDSCFDDHIYSEIIDELPDEIWKPVVGFEGYYSISSYGRVKSEARRRENKLGSTSVVRERIRTACDNEDGYLILTLYKDGFEQTKSIHRLVAEAFIPNPDNLPQVNHIDGDKHNNNINNLEWCDGIYNIRHSVEIGLRDYSEICKTVRKAYKIRNCTSGKIYRSASELARELHCSPDTIVKYIKQGCNPLFQIHGDEYEVLE